LICNLELPDDPLAERKLLAGSYLVPNVSQRDDTVRRVCGCTCDPTDDLLSKRQFAVVGRNLATPQGEYAQRAIRVPAVVKTRDRLLPRITALREADCMRFKTGLSRENAIVELVAPTRRPGENAQPLELFGLDRLGTSRSFTIDNLDRRYTEVSARKTAFVGSKNDRRRVSLELDGAFRTQPHPRKRRSDSSSEPRFGQQKKVFLGPTKDDQRRNDARLCRE
jgi:hypothetical protein